MRKKIAPIVVLFLTTYVSLIACKSTTKAKSEPAKNLSPSEGQFINTLYEADVVGGYYIDTEKHEVVGLFTLNKTQPNDSALGLAETTLLREQIQFENYLFKLPDSYKFVMDGDAPKILGNGSMGVAFVIQDQSGQDYVLKYFKQGGVVERIADLESLAMMSAKLGPKALTKSQKALIQKEGGAFEDIVFHTQQETEKAMLLKVTVAQYRNPELLRAQTIPLPYETSENTEKRIEDKIKAINEAKLGGMGSISIKELDLELINTKTKKVRKATLLIKPKLEGTLLKTLLEKGELNNQHVSAIQAAIEEMSYNGMFYDDLNEANWFLSEVNLEGGRKKMVATPFDMKPGRKISSKNDTDLEMKRKAIKANTKGMISKLEPAGLKSGEKRKALVKTKQFFGTGGFHANITTPKAKKSIQLLDAGLRALLTATK